MAEKKSKVAASKADHEPAAKTTAQSEGGSETDDGPKAGQPAGKSAKAEEETKDKPEAKTVAPSGGNKKPAATSGARPGDSVSAAPGGAVKSAPSGPGAKPSPASVGGRTTGGSVAWIVAFVLGLVIVIGFPLLIGSHGDEIDDLRAQLEVERQAIDDYPNTVAALAAIHAERADIEARRDTVQADIDGLLAEREEIRGALAETLAERDTRQVRVGELEAQIAALKEERGRLDGVVRATSDDLQAALALLEAARNRISQ